MRDLKDRQKDQEKSNNISWWEEYERIMMGSKLKV